MNNVPSPLHLANTAQQMSKTASPGDANAFNKIALACMVTVAIGSLLQVVHPIIKDLTKNRENHDKLHGHDHGRSR